jgi:hypothetical protein
MDPPNSFMTLQSLSKGEYNTTGLLPKCYHAGVQFRRRATLFRKKQTNWICPAPRASGLRPQLDSVVFPQKIDSFPIQLNLSLGGCRQCVYRPLGGT